MNNCFPWPSPTTPPTTTLSSVTPIAPSSSPPAGPFPGLPILNQQRGLTPPFVAPYLVVPVDSSNQNAVIGNQYTAQISATRSTLFIFNNDYDAGRICSLVFALPPTFDSHYPSPYIFNTPGGIQVSRLDEPADGTTSASASVIGGFTPVGSIPQLMPGNKYVIHSGPCQHGLAGYRIDSTGGLDLNFFQMPSPALGLFMEVV
jgi:glucan endo-1,3-beta-D-glucosidase